MSSVSPTLLIEHMQVDMPMAFWFYFWVGLFWVGLQLAQVANSANATWIAQQARGITKAISYVWQVPRST